ncbi:MAG: hypothetical protein M1840_001434 [Geoglossum simile]|nr:MAG: hypothetical protein M1840_001434 [Geoglossum simile]
MPLGQLIMGPLRLVTGRELPIPPIDSAPPIDTTSPIDGQNKLEFQRALEALKYQSVNLTREDSYNKVKRWAQEITWDGTWRAEEWRIVEPPSNPPPEVPDLQVFPPPPQMPPLPLMILLLQPLPQPLPQEWQQAAHRPMVWERGIYSSRPSHQFLYQRCRELIRLQAKFPECHCSVLDIQAVENIRGMWQSQGFWNPSWGDVPGTHWTHEAQLTFWAGVVAEEVVETA